MRIHLRLNRVSTAGKFFDCVMNRFRDCTAILLLMSLLAGCSGTGSTICCESNTGGSELSGETVRIVTLNLAHGRRDSMNQLLVSEERTYDNLDLIAALLQDIDPDVAAFQEADDPSWWSGGFDHVVYLAEQTGWSNYVHGLHADGLLFTFGTAILSQHRMADTSRTNFEPSFPTTTKGFVSATFDWVNGDNQTQLTVISVHLDFSRKSVREEQTEALISFARQLDGPFVIAGDLNSEWSDMDSSLRTLVRELELGIYMPDAPNMGSYKEPDGKRLDWILLSPELEFTGYATRLEIVSDHLAVVAEIGLR